MANKVITLTHKEKTYKLEYTREAVLVTERKGFNINEVFTYPNINVPMLIEGAFHEHHKWLRSEVIKEIYDDIPDKPDFVGKLIEMYNEPLSELLGLSEDANKGKKSKWEASF